ncbi:hypothetical protein RU09_06055 [Microbacterium sp. MEJ108Y]|uniref:DUF732 domain-containing protein n=1 Tax=Microbacterium sp. MEJ108Y TaxID=1587523 RepID=UPI0005ABB685|nr:DUF732 domain-containing protein [Microbacterium sp. MEJ108Y]KIP93374.1 hypothetical protein RU09_06055 [Microbacterium sp. MEJ108Y]
MKRTTLAVLAAALLIALTGCAGGTEDAEDERTAPAVSESAAPLVAEMPEESAQSSSPDEDYLTQIRSELPEDTVIPNATDEQLLTAAQDACAQIADGTDVLAVQVIEGEQANGLGYFESSAKIGAIASEVYCPLD